MPVLLSEPAENIRAYCKYLVQNDEGNAIPTLHSFAHSYVREGKYYAPGFEGAF